MPAQDPQTGRFVADSPSDPVEVAAAELARLDASATPAEQAAVPTVAPAEAPAAGERELDLYAVKVDGQEEQVTLREALDGYQRRETFNRRMAELHEQRREIEAQREALYQAARGPMSPGLGIPGLGTPPAGPLYQDGGQRYSSADNPFAGYGQPGVQGPSQQQPWETDDDPTQRQLAALRGEVMQMRASVQQQEAFLKAQREVAAQEFAISQLARKYPDFDLSAVEENLNRLSPQELAAYQTSMSKAAAYELLHLRSKAGGSASAPAQKTVPQAGAAAANLPFVEGASGAGRQVGNAPLAPIDGSSSREDMIAFAERLIEKGKTQR